RVSERGGVDQRPRTARRREDGGPAFLDEKSHERRVVGRRRGGERSISLGIRRAFDRRALREEELDGGQTAGFARREEYGRVPLFRADIHGGAAVHEQFHAGETRAAPVERGGLEGVFGVDVGAGVDEAAHHRLAADRGRVHERRAAAAVLQVRAV